MWRSPRPSPVVQILPVGGLTLLLGADRFMSEIRAAGHLPSNIVATLVAARTTGAIDLALAKPMLGGRKGGRTLAADAVPVGAIPEFAE
jgi:Na+/H+-dicarboxylate symporter